MIIFEDTLNIKPYIKFKHLYKKATNESQQYIEAAVVSTISEQNRPSSRIVNIKYLINEAFIFFSNYESNKAKDIFQNPKASILFFWDKINTQIRIEGEISMTESSFSEEHFNQRSYDKNIIAIISKQSSQNEGYEDLVKRYKVAHQKYKKSILERPNNWGGYKFIPDSFEFWFGDKSRINKRLKYIKKPKEWEKLYLDP
tara:strand:+ start:28411 stop:29010 length:600 start_codon:yes stop_codon:yes gene_type:complete